MNTRQMADGWHMDCDGLGTYVRGRADEVQMDGGWTKYRQWMDRRQMDGGQKADG